MSKKKPVEHVYIGERLHSPPLRPARVIQVFRSVSGEIAQYTKVRQAWPGSAYMISHDGTISTRPDRIPEEQQTVHWTDEERKQHYAHQILIKAWRAERRAGLSLKKPHADITRAVTLLTPFCRSLDRWDIGRLMRWIENEVQKQMRPQKKKRRR